MPGPPVDPQRPRDGNAFDDGGLFGQDHARDREAGVGGRGRAATPLPPAPPEQDIPPDNGNRASVDPTTGEVHGSGAGAGGGQPGEDFDSDAATGDGYPITGGEGALRAPGDLGPAPTGR